MLSTFSITALSVLIRVTLSFLSDNLTSLPYLSLVLMLGLCLNSLTWCTRLKKKKIGVLGVRLYVRLAGGCALFTACCNYRYQGLLVPLLSLFLSPLLSSGFQRAFFLNKSPMCYSFYYTETLFTCWEVVRWEKSLYRAKIRSQSFREYFSTPGLNPSQLPLRFFFFFYLLR